MVLASFTPVSHECVRLWYHEPHQLLYDEKTISGNHCR